MNAQQSHDVAELMAIAAQLSPRERRALLAAAHAEHARRRGRWLGWVGWMLRMFAACPELIALRGTCHLLIAQRATDKS